MDYYIKDISEILQISCDMIRYYEKKGVISPKRDTKSNYRVYSIMDLLDLAEAIHLKEFDINIGEISHVKKNDYIDSILNRLIAFRKRLVNNVKRENLLIERSDELIERYRISRANLGRFWVKHIPAYCKYQFCFLENNHFHDIIQSRSTLHSLFSSTVTPFCDGIIEFLSDTNIWYIAISDMYCDFLDIPAEEKVMESSRFCLCNVVDIDKTEGFSSRCYDPLIRFAKEEGYVPDGNITGLLCSMGFEKNNFKRYLEVRMPIKL